MPDNVYSTLRAHQEAHRELGGLFKALHAFADRTAENYLSFRVPQVVIQFEKIKGSRCAMYQRKTGAALEHVVTIDQFKVRNGVEAAEYLAHELVHAYQALEDPDLEEDKAHTDEFRTFMAEMGIAVRDGVHVGYIGDIWDEWIKFNEDLELNRYVLPGPQDPKRTLRKWQCPECGFSFRTRKENLMVTCWGDDEHKHPPSEMLMVE